LAVGHAPMRIQITWFGVAPGGRHRDGVARPSGGYDVVVYSAWTWPSGSLPPIRSRAQPIPRAILLGCLVGPVRGPRGPG